MLNDIIEQFNLFFSEFLHVLPIAFAVVCMFITCFSLAWLLARCILYLRSKNGPRDNDSK